MQKFELKRVTDIAPACGEDLGAALVRAADECEARGRGTETASVVHWGPTVAQMLYLASDAYRAAAGASIGHNRSARYDEAAARHESRAVALEAEAKATQAAHDDAAHLAACKVGYEGGDVMRYSFDRRDAAFVGQHFAKLGKPMPPAIHCTRDVSSDRHFSVEGEVYAVRCPSGRIADSTVELVS